MLFFQGYPVRIATSKLGLLLSAIAALLLFGASAARAGYVAPKIHPILSATLSDAIDLNVDDAGNAKSGMVPAPKNENESEENIKNAPNLPTPLAAAEAPGAGAPSSGASSSGSGATATPLALMAPIELPHPAMISRLVGEQTSFHPPPFPSGLFRPPRG